MPTLAGGYYVDGKRVPSVTTVLSRYKESGPLIHWAWNEGKEGRDYRESRDQAANAGTLAHDLVDRWARGEENPQLPETTPPDIAAKARGAFEAFLEWSKQTNLRIYRSEVALVSNAHRFGGTLDAMLVNDRLAIGDWKTSNAIYGDYLLQLAAYAILWEENNPDKPIVGGYHILRFSKEHGDFEHRFFRDVEAEKKHFLLLREAYGLDAELKKRVR